MMGQRRLRAGFPFAQGNLLVVVADPDSSSNLRRETHKPGVSEILGGAGFPRDRTPKRFCLDGGAELHDFLEHGRHGVRHVR